MGPDSNSGTVVAYLDGKPMEVGHPMPEITPDYSAGGVSAAEAEESLAAMTAAMSGMTITMEVAVEGLQEFFYHLELAAALHLARIFKPELVRRYQHTKKKRTRKKYEKRILAWFGEVWGKCSD